ncbi:MAG: iron-containing alcohol dehydrogenase [Pseudomonadota bacterium]
MALLTYLTTAHFDFGAIARLPKEMARLGMSRPLIVTDAGLVRAGLLERVTEQVEGGSALPVFDGTPANPTEKAVMAAFSQYGEEGCDGVIALGGGSSMDLGKAVALLAGSGGPLDKFDPANKGTRNMTAVAPVIAVPTTSGTGSEVSVGIIIVMDDGRKATFAGPKLIPASAICDPELTLGLPPLMTAATGMDAITHCIEAFLAPTENPPADGVALDGLWRGWTALKRAVDDGSDRDARWNMMMASTEGALAFIKGLGAVHSMSHAAGRLSDLNLHHGTLNAVLLPAVLRFNASGQEERYARLRQAMGLEPGADIADAIAGLNASIGLPANLTEMGLTEARLGDMVPYAVSDLATRTNPRPVGTAEFEALYRESF